MKPTVIHKKPTRSFHVFASLWSLRQYPTHAREWSWDRKFRAIQDGGFEGVFSPPLPILAERGALAYLAVTSLGTDSNVAKALQLPKDLGAVAIDVQLCDYDTPLSDALTVALEIRQAAREIGIGFAIETHRDTFTETPEATLALFNAYRDATGEDMPCCLDHSHFAVVRHIAPPYWPRLKVPVELLRAATQYHLRPFNGHHCQIPALSLAGRRTAEYRSWLEYATELLLDANKQPSSEAIRVVPEIGHAAPAYRLSGFPDTWRDVLTVSADLRRIQKGAENA